MLQQNRVSEMWPSLHYDDWKETLATLHMWTQVVGKIRLTLEPMLNHWWQVPLYVSTRGLTTSPMHCGGGRTAQIDFDFIEHDLIVRDCEGSESAFALEPMPVAHFYRRVMEQLHAIGIDIHINTRPVEVQDAIPFERDLLHKSYDRVHVQNFWRALVQADRLCKVFRARFTGKASPVHFFWGSFDLAVTRFSGRRAPRHPGGIPNTPDRITFEAYSHECSSAGFWPGGYGMEAMFYSYAYPEPEGFAQAHVTPSAAYYNAQMKEFLLPYETVRQSDEPDADVLAFFQSTYEAAANLGKWDRGALER